MLADDTSLRSHNSDIPEITTKFQHGNDRLITWSEQSHMDLNAQQTKCIYVSTLQKRPKLSASFQRALKLVLLKSNSKTINDCGQSKF